MSHIKFLFAMGLVTFSSVSFSQDIMIHKLRVAANPTVDVKNRDVDSIIEKMNELIKTSSYGWDDSCPDIRFVRDGDVIQNVNLATGGTFEQQRDSLKAHAPDANVLVTFGINCTGVKAAGCGVVGVEPLIVMALGGASAYYGPQLWLHERGHNVGLKHSGESPDEESSVGESIGKRFMFWKLGQGHIGKIKDECNAFRHSPFMSVSRTQGPPQVYASAAMIPGMEDDNQTPSSGSSGSSGVVQSSPEDVAVSAKKEGLTIRAYNVVAIPWVSDPQRSIAELSEEDLNSIRGLLGRADSSFTAQAVQVLGMRGNSQDIALLKRWIDAPLPAVIPGDTSDETRDAIRQFKQTKLAAPSALGELAKRTQSEEAVNVLKDASKADSIIAPTDPAVNVAAQKNAIEGLSVADTEKSREYVKNVLNLQSERSLAEPVTKSALDAARAVPLSPDERRALSDTMQKKE